MDIGYVDRVAKQAGYNVPDRMAFEAVDNNAQRFVVIVGEAAAVICDVIAKQGGTALDCAAALRAHFQVTNPHP